MLSKSFELIIAAVYERARKFNHEFVTLEHLLLGLLEDAETQTILLSCGVNVPRLKATLDIYIEETTPRFSEGFGQAVEPTLAFQRVLQKAIEVAQKDSEPYVDGPQVLLAMYLENESQAIYFLQQEQVKYSDLVKFITNQSLGEDHASTDHNTQHSASSDNAQLDFSLDHQNPSDMSAFSFDKPKVEEPSLIEQFTENLNQKAKDGKIDKLVGRDSEIERCIQVLCRRRKNNPMLVGEAGVGKTAIAEGLAKRIVDNNVPEALADATIFSLDLASLLAGTKYRGDFEKRFKAVLTELTAEKQAIIFIDEIHNLVGAGAAMGSSMDASNLMKPLLSSGEIRCMGATTYEEYRLNIEKDNALSRRFQKIDVVEPTAEESLEILRGLRDYFEAYHHISYTDEALERAIALSSRYMLDRHLPDKAIDVIDEAGAYQKMLASKDRQDKITVADIDQVVARMARIPVEKLATANVEQLKLLPERLKAKIYGQNHAVDILCDAIKLSKAGLKNPNKPMGSFLLAGPTGVGKTEVVKQLAEELGVELLRFDMSEYMERHSISRLIGSPPGYVGHEQAGLLTEAIIKNPHAVLLLDEIEKAHPDIFNILLQVMDYGQLTDNNGRKADFRHVIITMTSNVGAKDMTKNSLGFVAGKDPLQDGAEAVKTAFSPEFRNRLDAVVPFKQLDQRVVLQVVDKTLLQLQAQCTEHHVRLEVPIMVREWLAEKGFDPMMGARPLERIIAEKLKKPLAEELLFGERAKDSEAVIHVSLEGDELLLRSEAVL